MSIHFNKMKILLILNSLRVGANCWLYWPCTCVLPPYHLFLVRAAMFVDLQAGTSDMNLNIYTLRMTQAKVDSIMKRKHTQ